MFHFTADDVYHSCSQEQIFALAHIRDTLAQQLHQARMYAVSFGLEFHVQVNAVFSGDNINNVKFNSLKQDYNEYLVDAYKCDQETLTIPSSLLKEISSPCCPTEEESEEEETSDYYALSQSSSPNPSPLLFSEQNECSEEDVESDVEFDYVPPILSYCSKTEEGLSSIQNAQNECLTKYKEIMSEDLEYHLHKACLQLSNAKCIQKWFIPYNHIKLVVAQMETKHYVCFLTHAPRLIEPFVNYRSANAARYISGLQLNIEKVLLMTSNDNGLHKARKPTYFLTQYGLYAMMEIAKKKKHYIKLPATRKYADFLELTLSKTLTLYKK